MTKITIIAKALMCFGMVHLQVIVKIFLMTTSKAIFVDEVYKITLLLILIPSIAMKIIPI